MARDGSIRQGTPLPIRLSGPDDTYADWEQGIGAIIRRLKLNGPYHGILGFSQGANMATIVAALVQCGALPWADIRFFVLLCGSKYGWADDLATTEPLHGLDCVHFLDEEAIEEDFIGFPPLLTEKIRIPAFIQAGEKDPRKENTYGLVQLFDEGSCHVVTTPEGHSVTSNPSAVDAMAALVARAMDSD
uniref:Serine hydrolase domain-containing protein n=1 Tax=Octactis speculum TaxID=3111310 RepID=A0A7S2C881_9STRA|mmetsp:Transcript_32726/g.44303  ORF Transcript_32726/g.44303 Transcript_32726/m.44303 type:complete len:189 (+) Transcript_32726:66-632(+)